jgi:NodT family efflux transporter outer membrane factor (OMF) lipoprotein
MTIACTLRLSRIPLLAVLSLQLSACVLGKDYVAPQAPGVDRIAAKPLPAATASAPLPGGESQRFVEGGVLPARWWTQFGSEMLNAWVDEAFAKSPTLASVEAKLRQQQALLQASSGSLYPVVSANATANRNKTSGSAYGGSNIPGSIFNLFGASVAVDYGLDLWGGTRRTIEGQSALLEAQQQQTSAAYLSLAGNVVTSAISVASAQARLQTAKAIVDSYKDTVRLAQKRYELGASAKSDVLAVRSLLAQSEADIPALEQELAVASNRLAILLGRMPSEFDSGEFDLASLTLPQEIPVALPSELVQRRPDIAAASAALHVASANVGIASANRLPSLLLHASIGTQAGKASQLFDETIWSLAGNLTAPLFDAGTLRAQQKAAVAAYEAAEADYRNTVLNAFGQVADTLSALETDARSLAALQTAFDVAKQSAEITEARYKTGSATIFDVRADRLTAARALQRQVAAVATRFQDTAALFQALGGTAWPTASGQKLAAGDSPAASVP